MHWLELVHGSRILFRWSLSKKMSYVSSWAILPPKRRIDETYYVSQVQKISNLNQDWRWWYFHNFYSTTTGKSRLQLVGSPVTRSHVSLPMHNDHRHALLCCWSSWSHMLNFSLHTNNISAALTKIRKEVLRTSLDLFSSDVAYMTQRWKSRFILSNDVRVIVLRLYANCAEKLIIMPE